MLLMNIVDPQVLQVSPDLLYLPVTYPDDSTLLVHDTPFASTYGIQADIYF